MGKRRIALITDYRDLIPQRIQEYEGYDLDALQDALKGLGFATTRMGFHDEGVCNVGGDNPQNTAVIYASSQQPEYVAYLRAILSNLAQLGVTLIPSLGDALAHEDKIYQGLRLSVCSQVKAPRSYAFGFVDHAEAFLRTASYPLVWKTPRGFGSAGVRLVKSETEARWLVRTHLLDGVLTANRSLWRRAADKVVRRRGLGRVLFQDFIPGCTHDWKVLIWGNVACGLKRWNRPGDFRASSSGNFSFEPVPHEVLEFAFTAQRALSLPWASLDVLEQERSGDKPAYWLAEYQAVHFGLTTAMKGTFFYERDGDGRWRQHSGRINVEKSMATATAAYWRKRP